MGNCDPFLARAIADASCAAFADWRRKHPKENVFAFALSTIDDAIYVSAALNTEESHRRALKKQGLDANSKAAAWRRWSPTEWEFEFLAPSHFKQIDKRLKQMYEVAVEANEAEVQAGKEEKAFGEFRETVFESMIAGLVLLRTEGQIPDLPRSERVTFFAMIYDSFSSERIERASAVAANSPDCRAEYLASIS